MSDAAPDGEGLAWDASIAGLYILDILGRPVEAIPPGGGVGFIDEIRLTVAGTAGGTAVACAKLGLATRAVGAVGADEKGDFVLSTLGRHGVDTALMQRLPGIPTSATILNVRPNGERPALHARGASDRFTLAEADMPAALGARFVHLGGTGLLAAFDGAPSAAFLRAAKAAGRTTTHDLIAATPATLALVEPMLPYVDYFVPSIEEAQAMAGLEDPDAVARFFLDRGAGTVLLTMGGAGSLVRTADGARLRLPALSVDVVDTTGCGDAYTAGLIAALARGRDLEAAVRFATAAGALVATGLGSDAGLVSFAHTEATMRMLPEKRL